MTRAALLAKRIALPAAVATLLALAARLAPLLAGFYAADGPNWLPTFGDPLVWGQVYAQALSVLGTVAIVAIGLWIGRRVARRDEPPSYRRLFAVAFAGGTLALLAAVGAGIATLGMTASSVWFVALLVAALLAAIPLVTAAAALAGFAVTRDRAADPPTDGRRSLPGVRVAVAAGAAAVLVVALDSAVSVLLAASDAVGLPGWLPQYGSVGMSTAFYSQAFQFLSAVAVVGLGCAIGLVAARRGVDRPRRRFAGLVAAGSGIGALAALVALASFLSGESASQSPLLAVVSPLATTVTTALVLTIAALAGVGVVRSGSDLRERSDPDSPSTPVEVESPSADDERPEPADADSESGDANDESFADGPVTETPASRDSLRDH